MGACFTFNSRDNPGNAEDFLATINPHSFQVLNNVRVELRPINAKPKNTFQFETEAYFCADRYEHKPDDPVFSRTITLCDNWAKIEAKED